MLYKKPIARRGKDEERIPVNSNHSSISITISIQYTFDAERAAFASIIDKVNVVYGFKQGEGVGGWTIYNPAWEATHPEWNTLTTVYRGRGYEISVTENCTLIYGDNSYPLDAGWNRIGWHGYYAM